MSSILPIININEVAVAAHEDIIRNDKIPFWNKKSQIIAVGYRFINILQKPNNYIHLGHHGSTHYNYSSFHDPITSVINNNIDCLAAKRIFISPNTLQIDFLKKCFGSYRFTYNHTVDFLIKKYNIDIDYIPCFKYERKNIMNELNSFEWLNETPYDIKTLAIKQCFAMYKSAKSNGHLNNKFVLGYLTKNNNKQIVYFQKNAIRKDFRLYPQTLGKIYSTLKMCENDKIWLLKRTNKEKDYLLTEDFSIIKDNNKYYLNICYKKNIINIDKRNKLVALDPGVRTFQSYYSSDSCGKLGTDTPNKIKKIHERIIMLEGLYDKVNSRKRYKLKKRVKLLRAKITNIVSDLHWKTANYLVKNYENILIPTFNTKQMVMKSKNKHMNRMMMSLSHYSFRQRLIHTASKVKNTNVILCRENHTTKTCSLCGNIDNNVGINKIYKCQSCGIMVDRDINGARNILIRACTKALNRVMDQTL